MADKSHKKALFGWLLRGVKYLCMTLGVFVLLSMTISIVSLIAFSGGASGPDIPDRAVLYLEFEDGFYETDPLPSLTNPLRDSSPVLRDYIRAIDAAAKDDRVEGILARMRDGSFEVAHSDEIHEALTRFRESGKFTHIYADSYGDGGGGLSRYYLASAFETLWMQPLGVVAVPGIHIEIPFVRRLLDRVGVTPQFLKRKDYKTAYESFTDESISSANRESMEGLVGDLSAHLLARIAQKRQLNKDYLQSLIDKGLFTSERSVETRLIDRADYLDVLVDDLQEQILGDRESEEALFVNLEGYLSDLKGARDSKAAGDKVALIYAIGAIMPSDEGGQMVVAADEIAPAIFDAIEDEDVRAIVLRIDSPGGSPVASESILRALQVAQSKGIKVIVSMGPVAASGGYWIAASADQIFVSPATITGSIGVIGGKFVLRDVFEKLGVNWDSVRWGDNAGLWSFNHEFTQGEKARIDMMLDHVYDSFVARVAEGREMSVEAVDAVAGGRVWSGAAALQNGLADQAGGLMAALSYAAEEVAGNKDSLDQVDVIILPEPLTPFEQFIDVLGGQVALGQWLGMVQAQFKLLTRGGAMTYAPLQLQ